jgi:hypothetical protein
MFFAASTDTSKQFARAHSADEDRFDAAAAVAAAKPNKFDKVKRKRDSEFDIDDDDDDDDDNDNVDDNGQFGKKSKKSKNAMYNDESVIDPENEVQYFCRSCSLLR